MLFNSVILEVAIGLFFIYLVTTLICSGISELIAGLLNLRAKRLREGIRNLLQEDSDNAALIQSFYTSPLIKGLKTPSLWDSIKSILPSGKKRKSDPSYIPANVFARVLRDVLASPPGANELTKDWHEVWDYMTVVNEDGTRLPKSDLTPAQRELLGVLKTAGLDSDRAVRLKSLQAQLVLARKALREFAAPSDAPIGMTGQYLMDRVANLEKGVQQAEKDVNDALERAQLYVEDYFNQAMERVSGWYKRNIQIALVAIALIITLLLNIDSLYIIDTLMQAPTTRAALIQMAETHVTQAEATLTNEAIPPAEGANAAALPTPEAAEPAAATPPAETTLPAESGQPAEAGPSLGTATLATFDEIEAAGLNLGWDRCIIPLSVDSWLADQPMLWFDASDCTASSLPRSTDGSGMWVIKKVLGLMLTIIAASLGAPFWFDMLNKAVNLRLTGQKPPEKSITAQYPPAA